MEIIAVNLDLLNGMMGKLMIPKYLDSLIVNLVIIACVIFISCGDEGELVTAEPPSPQQPSQVERIPEPPPVEQIPQPQPEPPRVEQMPEPAAVLPGLPNDIAGYEGWLKLNAEPIPPAEGGDPHRGTKNVYVNQTREVIAPNGQQKFPYPDGTIVVKEATRPGKDFIGLVAVMWKEAGSNPAFGDWRFEEFLRNAPDAEFRLAFEGAVCTGCHSGAAATDFVFVTLE